MPKLKISGVLFLSALLFASCEKEELPENPPPPPPPPAPPAAPAANYEDSLKNGLWAYFDFNNGSFNDQSNKNHHMAGFNGVGFSFDTYGNANNALQLDGVDDYAVIDSGKQFVEGSFTVSFLMMPKSNFGRIFQKANFNDAKGAAFGFGFSDISSQNLDFYVANDNNLCNNITSPSTLSTVTVPKVIYPNAWYQVALQHVNGVEKVYINGELAASRTTPNNTFKNCSTAPFYLGMWWMQDKKHFGGKIDELRIYTRALSDNEIRYLFTRLP